MNKKTVSLSGLPGLSEAGQTGHIEDAGIEFPAGLSQPQRREFCRLLRQEQEIQRLEWQIRLHSLAAQAAEVLAKGVEKGDLGASIALLETIGLLEPGAFDYFDRERKEREVKQPA